MVTQPPALEDATVPGACLKVAFVGTHGVGKTTLCFELGARLKRMNHRVDLVKEVARMCPLPLNRDTTIEAQAWILHRQISGEIEGMLDQDVLICDRSALDNYAYMVEKFGRVGPYDALVAAWLPTYTLLVWIPVLEDPRYDGVRDTDRQYQRRIEEVIAELVPALGARPFRLDPAQRANWIDLILERLPLRSLQLPLFGEDIS